MALPSSPRSLTPAQGVHLATAVKGAVFGEKHTGARFQVAATVQHCSLAAFLAGPCSGVFCGWMVENIHRCAPVHFSQLRTP